MVVLDEPDIILFCRVCKNESDFAVTVDEDSGSVHIQCDECESEVKWIA